LDPEGFLLVNGVRVFYRSEGEPTKGTVLGLHGGPGGSYDYLTPLFDLARHGYRVVLYDQSGGGKSQRLKDPSMFTVERFVAEVEGVRSALKLGKVHLYGHSWGGMLAQAYALEHQSNLVSLTLSGTASSIKMLMEEGEKVFQTLPADVRKKITKHESDGDFTNPEYLAALDEFNHRHQALADPWPEALKYVFENFSLAVTNTMFGPNMVAVVGNMRYWDVTDRLPTLKVPCLIICGDRDFLTPKLHETMNRKIRGSKLVVMKGVSHGSMWDDRAGYVGHLASFLDSVRR
jgi:proline iminopeptidase